MGFAMAQYLHWQASCQQRGYPRREQFLYALFLTALTELSVRIKISQLFFQTTAQNGVLLPLLFMTALGGVVVGCVVVYRSLSHLSS
jgi:hypothetical protein